MLLLEIVLLVKAWKKGWGAKALLPVASGFVLMFLIGVALGVGGATRINFAPLGFLIDVGVVVALALMVRRAPSPAVETPLAPVPLAADNSTVLAVHSH
jgi:hypothetical protein